MQQPNNCIDQFFDSLKMYLLAGARTADEIHEIDKHINVMKHEAKSLDALLHGRMHEAVIEQIHTVIYKNN